MQYRRKSDGVIVEIERRVGLIFDDYKVEEKTPSLVFVYWVSEKKFERDYEKVEEEKPMDKIKYNSCQSIESKPYTTMKECERIRLMRENEEKPMHNFKVGDRINVYTGKLRITGFTITEIKNDLIKIKDEFADMYYHHKQCRKLKKRERKRIWANISADGNQLLGVSNISTVGWIEFVEVRKK